MGVLPACIYMYTACIPVPMEARIRALDSLEFLLPMEASIRTLDFLIVSCCVGAQNQTQVPWKSHLSSPKANFQSN